MAATTGKPAGILVRGADGKHYFIPGKHLKQFALPAKHQQALAKARHKGKVLKDIGVATSDNVSSANVIRRRVS